MTPHVRHIVYSRPATTGARASLGPTLRVA